MARIFLSYRKQGEDKPISLRLADQLRSALGESTIFRDEKGLKIGRFEDQLLRIVQSCDAMVAVIGPTWINRIDDLRDENDWVRRELEIGLKRQILMVPVLVSDARRPKILELPESLHGIFQFQFVTIHSKYWVSEVDDLIDSIADALDITREKKTVRQPDTAANLSGNWLSNEGEIIRIDHQGSTLRMIVLNSFGQMIGEGSGRIQGDQADFSIKRMDIGFGTGKGTLHAGGNLISGYVSYGYKRFAFDLTRQ